MKSGYDAVAEMRFTRNRFRYEGNQHGTPYNKHKCFICGEKSESGNGICGECEREFPTIRQTKPTN